jgi:hypothetical protein
MAENALNLLVLVDYEFQRRFPKEYAAWDETHA